MHLVIIRIIRIGNHWVYPRSLVGGVWHHLRHPWSLVIWIVDRRGFPLAIVLVIPIIWLLGIWVRHLCWDVIVSFGFHNIGIFKLSLFHPVSRFGLRRIFDLLICKKVKLLFKLSSSHRFVVREDFKCVVGPDNEGVQMRQLILFTRDIFVDKKIVIFLIRVKNNMGSFGSSADIRSKHDSIWGITTEFIGVKLLSTRKELNVCASTVDFLLMFHFILNDKVFSISAVKGLGQRRTQTIESSILRCLDTLISFVGIPFSRGMSPFTKVSLGLPSSGNSPPITPFVVELFFEVKFSRNRADKA
mmetsp:Transcript_662/g.1211  ORF Transcript_662/g.1211 Transcript_662/m.1211 type:complete len:302 (-) Transcript_662:104-1009(-)